MGYTVTTGPSEEPVLLAEVKTWLRITRDNEDTLLSSQISAARQQAELNTGLAFISQTIRVTLDRFPEPTNGNPNGDIILPLAPLTAITSIQYYKTGEVSLETLNSATYAAVADSMPPRITLAENQNWPATQSRSGAVTVTYTAGAAAAANVDEQVKLAMRLMIRTWYDRKDGVRERPTESERVLDLIKVYQYDR